MKEALRFAKWSGTECTNQNAADIQCFIKSVVSYKDNILILLQDGHLTLGCGGLTPVSCEIPIRDICEFNDALHFIGKDGQLFKGFLNFETNAVSDLKELWPLLCCPHNFKCLDNGTVKFQKLSAGIDHLLLLSTDSQIWVMGKGTPCGVYQEKEFTNYDHPVMVDFFKSHTVLDIAAGAYHSVALLKKVTPDETPVDHSVVVEGCKECQQLRRDLSLESADTCPLGVHVDPALGRKEKIKSSSDSSLGRCMESDAESNSVYLPGSLEDLNRSVDSDSDKSPVDIRRMSIVKSLPRKWSSADVEAGQEALELQSLGESSSSVTSDGDNHSRSEVMTTIIRAGSKVSLSNMTAESAKYLQSTLINPVFEHTHIIRENLKGNVSHVASAVFEGVKNAWYGPSMESDGSYDFTCEVLKSKLLSDMMIKDEWKSCEDFKGLNKEASFSYSPYTKTLMRRKQHCRKRVGGSLGSIELVSKVISMPSVVDAVDFNLAEKEHFLMRGHVAVNTEVWTWGYNDSGQLGYGDTVNRNQPSRVDLAHDDFNMVAKIACKGYHTAVLTRDGLVYAWGENNYGQLKPEIQEAKGCFSTPEKVSLGLDSSVRDIATGSQHLVLVTEPGDIIILGKPWSKTEPGYGKVKMDESFSDMTPQQMFVSHCSVVSVFTSRDSLSKLSLEFIEHEICFLSQCKMVTANIVRPLLSIKMGNKILTSLLNRYLDVHNSVAALLMSARTCNNSHDIPNSLLVQNPNDMIDIFVHYAQAFCSALVMNVFYQLSQDKKAVRVIESGMYNINKEYPQIKEERSEELINYFLVEPVRMMKHYADWLRELKKFLVSREEGSVLLKERLETASVKWDKAMRKWSAEVQSADMTRLFWETRGNRISETLRLPDRRLLEDSRSQPLHYQAARKNSHWFLLFNDVFLTVHGPMVTVHPLETVWIEPLLEKGDAANNQHGFTVITPEDTLVFACPTLASRNLWLNAFRRGIRQSLKMNDSKDSQMYLNPPLVRHAKYTFSRLPALNGATYSGSWFRGKMYYEGEVVWPDGRKQKGRFRQNQLDGFGEQETQTSDGPVISIGNWVGGHLNGWGLVKYHNGDVYEGFYKDGHLHGFGTYKSSRHSSAATFYTGGWENGVQHGYGVTNDFSTQEKHMGMWVLGNKSGPGCVTSLDSIYYEGNFTSNGIQGFGLMMFDDGTYYEGDLSGPGVLNGKGTVHLFTGDRIEASFNGKWNEGIQIQNGMFYKAAPVSPIRAAPSFNPSSYMMLCVSAEDKWESVFAYCREILSITGSNDDGKKCWSSIAVILSRAKQGNIYVPFMKERKKDTFLHTIDSLETTPVRIINQKTLTLEDYHEIKEYLKKAFSFPVHPLGQLLCLLVDAYRASYLSGAHARLLPHAVDEIHSITKRIYRILRTLFPSLPSEDIEVELESSGMDSTVVNPSGLVHPFIMADIYTSVFTLYVLHHQPEDKAYWERVLKWNRQSDDILATFLGVEEKLLPFVLATKKDSGGSLEKAAHTLQSLSTAFTSTEKLLVLRQTFQEINKMVGDSVVWSMDALFPVFQLVVVRARIPHLGAEIHLMEDLMEQHLRLGELGHMFTTLTACYFQIRHEKQNIG